MKDNTRSKKARNDESVISGKKTSEPEVRKRKTVTALRKSEEFFRAITQNSQDIIIIVDKKGTITHVNPSIERFLGYKPEELIGKSGFLYINPSDIPRAIYEFGKAILTRKEVIPNTFSIRHKDGSEHILEGVGKNLLDNPAVSGFVMNVRDITERRKAETELNNYRKRLEELVEERTSELAQINSRLLIELAERKQITEALMESEEKFQDFLEQAPIGFCIVDMSGYVQYVNRLIEAETGWTREELIGKDGFSLGFFDDETRQILQERLTARLMGDAPITLEIPVFCKNGNRLWVELKTTIIRKDGLPSGVQLAFINITERKNVEDALRETENKFRDLSEESVVGIYLIQDNIFKYVNARFAEIFGYGIDDIKDKMGPIDVIDPEDFPLVDESLRKRISGELTSIRYEFRIITKSREIRHAEVYSSRTAYQGKPAVIGTLLDISERKQMEEERQKLHERLYRAEKMEALGTLAGGVAHDLNNVLGVMAGYAELLLLKTDMANPLRHYVTSIMNSSLRAAAIVQDLLTMARRGVQTEIVVNLNAVVLDYQKTPEFEKLCSFHPHVRVETDLGSDLLNIMGSPVHLGKTIMNLVSNAAEAMPGGGVLTVKTANQYLDKPVSGYDHVQEGDYAVLSVSDMGEGISANDLKRIFEPFYTKKVMGRSGTGLGLSVVWGAVKDHNGYINVQTQERKGTTFSLYFPVTREKVSPEDISVPVAEYFGNGESILVVDDVDGQRELAARMLAELDYQAETVSSGEEALKFLKKRDMDLVVLDMIMDPGMDGLDTYREILKISPQQKAIIVSGFSETDRVKQAQALGAGSYVRKPYVLEKLGMAVRQELDRPA